LVVTVTAVFLCAAGCNDGGVESGGRDAVAYLELFHTKAVWDAGGTFTDKRDGKKYKWVTIGDQMWMAENLNYETGNSRCYDDDQKNCAKYGRLYDWETALTVCPAGWSLPLINDVWKLMDVGGEKLKAKSGWEWSYSSDEDGNGSDDFGFNALPGGGHFLFLREGEYGSSERYDGFKGINYSGYWWIVERGHDRPIRLLGEEKELGFGSSGAYTLGVDSVWAALDMCSVRCLRDN